MRRKLAFLVAVFCATVLAMAVQKPVFMAWYAAEAAGAGFGGWMEVLWHGLTLDMTVAGYVTALPLLAVLLSLWVRGEGGKSYDVSMFYRSYHVDIVDTQAKYLHMKKGADEKQGDKIIAPMPGKVVSIPVKAGDRLAAGDIAVVLEAMKMQSNYKVNADCVVKNILVNEGEPVNANQVLVELELIKEE